VVRTSTFSFLQLTLFCKMTRRAFCRRNLCKLSPRFSFETVRRTKPGTGSPAPFSDYLEVKREDYCLQCFDAVAWAAGRASGLEKLSDGVLG